MKNIIDDLIKDEGFELFPYTDSVGKITIGVGHNLTDNGLTATQIMLILKDDIESKVAELKKHVGVYGLLDDERQSILINMCFNLGIGGLLSFKKMLAALEVGDYRTASKEMLHSRWAGQVGDRAMVLSKRMREGRREAS